MKNKTVSLLLTLCLLLTLLPVSVTAKTGDEFLDEESGMRFSVLTEPVESTLGTVKLKSGGSAGGAREIPTTVIVANGTERKRYRVTEIEESAFAENTTITSVKIPDTVTKIPNAAFSSCTALNAITIPGSITEIGANAFFDCTALASVTFAEDARLNTIGESAFAYCMSLKAVSIPGSVIRIKDGAFSNCIKLESLTFPENAKLKTIGSNAFYYCFGYYTSADRINLVIPDGVTHIGNNPFFNCSAVCSITLPESLIAIGSAAFYGLSQLTAVNVPKSLTSIGKKAFDSELERNNTVVTFAAGSYEYFSSTTGTYERYPIAPESFGDVASFHFTGGSLNAPEYAMVTNGVPVYMTTVTLHADLGGVCTYADIDALLDESGAPISYNLTDTHSDSNGKLYLWLSVGTQLGGVRVRNSADGTVTTTYLRAGGALTVAQNNDNAGEYFEVVGNLLPISVEIYGNETIEAVVYPSNRDPFGYENGVYSDKNLVTSGTEGISYKLMFRQKHDGEEYSWVQIPDDYTVAGLYLNPDGMPSLPYSMQSDFTKGYLSWGYGYGGDRYSFTLPKDGARIVAIIIRKEGTAPHITTSSLPNGIIGRTYNYTLEADGDTPVEWSISTRPEGLLLNKHTGVISGISSQLQTLSVTVTATNSYGSHSVNYPFTVTTALDFTDSEDFDIPSAASGTAVTPIHLSSAVSGGNPPYSFTKVSGPDWLTVSSDGIVGGTRTGAAAPAQEAVVRVTDSMGETDEITLSIAEVTAGPLPTPTGLSWNGAVIQWDAVPGSGIYSLELYKDGTGSENKISLGLFGYSSSLTSADMTSYLMQNGTGTYYFRVKATAPISLPGESKAYLDSDWSAFSAGFSPPSVSYTFNKPAAITVNGITATVAYNRSSPQFAGAAVTATVTLTGTATLAGEIVTDFYSVKANTPYQARRTAVTAGQKMTAQNKLTVTFTMPAENVDDLTLHFLFVPANSRGDLTGDGVCDVFDCTLAELAVNGHCTLSPSAQLLLDFDTDGTPEMGDLQQLINCAVGRQA